MLCAVFCTPDFELTFVIYLNVGADIIRPAHRCYEFARTDAKTQHFAARAIDDRPYKKIDRLYDKRKFEHLAVGRGICGFRPKMVYINLLKFS